MDITDIQDAPYTVLRAEARSILHELTTGPQVVAPLREANLPVDALVDALRQVQPAVGEQRDEQIGEQADMHAAERRTSATVDEAARLIRGWWWAVEDEGYHGKPGPLARLHGLLEGHGLPSEEAPRHEVTARLGALARWCEHHPDVGVPGVSNRERALVPTLLARLEREAASVEAFENRFEAAARRSVTTRKELVTLCVRYFRWHRQLRRKALEAGVPSPPGGTFEGIAQWAATRPSARRKETELTDLPPLSVWGTPGASGT